MKCELFLFFSEKKGRSLFLEHCEDIISPEIILKWRKMGILHPEILYELIAAYQKSKNKIPFWAKYKAYLGKISQEQCSSEFSASLKAAHVDGQGQRS